MNAEAIINAVGELGLHGQIILTVCGALAVAGLSLYVVLVTVRKMRP